KVCAVVFFFFFSSRRRHTRWPRDWSSDVCSSDLEQIPRRQTVHRLESPCPPSLSLQRRILYLRNKPDWMLEENPRSKTAHGPESPCPPNLTLRREFLYLRNRPDWRPQVS